MKLKTELKIKSALQILEQNNIEYRTTNGFHFMINHPDFEHRFDFWPNTGKWLYQNNIGRSTSFKESKYSGSGVQNLVDLINKKPLNPLKDFPWKHIFENRI